MQTSANGRSLFVSHPIDTLRLAETPSFSMIVKVKDEVSTNKFQQSTTASEIAMMKKLNDSMDPSNPLNTVDGNSGPAFAFAKLNQSDLETVGADVLLPNRSDQAHFEVILWTSRTFYLFDML
jgi:hypothetical protein